MTYFAGIADAEFIRGDIPMTKREIRVFALNKAKIAPGDVVLDVGAGTGSLSIEAALASQTGRVYAIEREEEGIALIRTNAAKFGVAERVQAIHGSAPAAMQQVPPVDVVLIGGSGGSLPDILAQAGQLLKPGGRIVITAITLETLQTALATLEQAPQYQVEACGIQVTRIRKAGSSHMLQAINPIYIVAAEHQPSVPG